jgi:hypothetical protein
VSPSAAAVAGRSIVGEVALALSDADLAALTEGQRASLAEYLRSGAASLRGIEVAEATLGTLATLLDERAATNAARLAEEAATLAATDAAREAELAAIRLKYAGCPIEQLFDRLGSRLSIKTYPRGWKREPIEYLDLLGRRAEGEQFMRDFEQRMTDLVAAQSAAEATAKAARAAKVVSDRAEVREFLAPHVDATALDWFDALSDPSDARAEVRKIMVAALGAAIAAVVGGAAGDYLRPAGARTGHSIDPVTDLSVFRRVGALAAAVDSALAGDLYQNVWAEVENITMWRAAEAGEDGDEDGEVASFEWVRVRCEIGGLAVNLYTR